MHLRARTERFRSAIGRSSRARSSAREQFGVVGRLLFANLVGELAELQALRLQHVADFDQRRLAEILAGEQFLLAERVRSPSVMMPIFCRQLRLRTDSSKSVTGMPSTWLRRSWRRRASSS